MFEQTFKNIDDVLWKEAGCTTELDYTEQTSWMLFLKYLDDLELERAMEAELVGKSYDFLLEERFRWAGWAAPKTAAGEFDHDNAATGDDLIEFVNQKLFPYLQGFKQRASGPDTIEYKIGETIYDGACGSAGFLCESHDFMRDGKKKLTTSQLKTLQTRTFTGKEKKSLAYIIGIMNMILHGIEAPNIIHTNTLSENLTDIQEKDHFKIILANPPFGGKERKEVQQNFPIKTGETAFLFLQHFIKRLKAGGRAAVVIKNTFLSNSDNAAKALRKELLESCELRAVLDCPGGTFLGAGVKTVVLFFEKGAATRKTWYYQLDPGRSLGKTDPLNDDDLAEFVKLQKIYAESEQSWTIDAGEVDPDNFDLSVKNQNAPAADPIRSPEEILDEIEALDAEAVDVMTGIRGML